LFQPHRYTRVRALFDDFTRAFYQSDVLAVLPIYPAGEKAIPGLDGFGLYEGIRRHGHRDVVYIDAVEAAADDLRALLKPGDILLTLGAGDVWKVGEEILGGASPR
ncbi:MAG: UDP-N-acetylmuramate--L-alanine ligase, partial [Desulfobacterales bacterium]|nr:UDP-N-acetylmuramate--L-alanine ligase [Desulfobacterales bacterium]